MCVYTSVTEFVQVDWLFEHINLNAEFTLHGGGGYCYTNTSPKHYPLKMILMSLAIGDDRFTKVRNFTQETRSDYNIQQH